MLDTRSFSSVATQFVLACDLTAFYYLMTLRDGAVQWFFPQTLLLFGPLVYGVNRLFIRRERTLRGVFFLNVLLAVAYLVGYLWLEEWKGPAALIFTALFTAWMVGNGGWLAFHPLGLREALLYLDGSVLTLVIFTAYTASTGTELIWSVPVLCGFAASILNVTVCRAGHSLNGRSLAVLGAAFGSIFLVMSLLLGVVAAPAGEGLVALWGVLTGGVQAVLRGVYRLLLAIAALFPDPEPSTGQPLWDGSGNFNLELPVQEEDPAVPLVIVLLFLVLLAGLVVWILAQMGKVKLGRGAVKEESSAQHRERPSLWRGLCTLVASWAEFAQFRIFLWKNRSTPRGMYCLLVHRCRMGPWRKRPGETPREFLLRLAQCVKEQPDIVNAMEELARDVDAALYGRGTENKRVERSDLIIRQIKASLRRKFVRELLAKLRPVPSNPEKSV